MRQARACASSAPVCDKLLKSVKVDDSEKVIQTLHLFLQEIYWGLFQSAPSGNRSFDPPLIELICFILNCVTPQYGLTELLYHAVYKISATVM